MVTIDVARGTFVFDNSCGDYDGSIGAASETLSGFTTAYNTDSSVWNTRYSYNPENITCIDDVLYTFKNGTMYKHHDGVNRATYYGSADGSVVEVVAAFNPSMVKSYEAISLEGTAAWDTTINIGYNNYPIVKKLIYILPVFVVIFILIVVCIN